MSTFELKFFMLAWNEAKAFKMLKHEVDCLLNLCLNVWKSSAVSFRLRECHCVFLDILELAFKIIDFFILSVQMYF